MEGIISIYVEINYNQYIIELIYPFFKNTNVNKGGF